MARIALYGATGTIGSRVLREALGRGHEVTAVVRDPARFTGAPAAAVLPGDVLDPASVAAVAAGQDVVVSAVGPGSGDPAVLVAAARSLVGGIGTLDPDTPRPRLITVGGVPRGEAPGAPEAARRVMHAHEEALDFLRTVPVEEVRWTCLSPAARIAPGRRTGTYRLGAGDPPPGEWPAEEGDGQEGVEQEEDGQEEDGQEEDGGPVSAEDYAVALVDEIDRDAHAGRRVTVGA